MLSACGPNIAIFIIIRNWSLVLVNTVQNTPPRSLPVLHTQDNQKQQQQCSLLRDVIPHPLSLPALQSSREIEILEAAVAAATAKARLALEAAAVANAETRSARDETARANGEIELLRGQISALSHNLTVAAAKREETARALEQAEAELATLRPTVARQADDNALLREQLVEVRSTLGQAHALMSRLASEREGLESDLRHAQAVAERATTALAAAHTECGALKREVDASAVGLRAAQLEAANAADESARRGEELATALARVAALQSELDDVTAALELKGRQLASASEQVSHDVCDAMCDMWCQFEAGA